MFAEVFLAPVSQPKSKDLRDLLAFFVGERLVQIDRFLPFTATGAVFVRIPKHTRRSNAATDFFDQRDARQRSGFGLLLCRAQGSHF